MARQRQIGQKRSENDAEVDRERKASFRKWIKNVEGYLNHITQEAIEDIISNKKLERQAE